MRPHTMYGWEQTVPGISVSRDFFISLKLTVVVSVGERKICPRISGLTIGEYILGFPVTGKEQKQKPTQAVTKTGGGNGQLCIYTWGTAFPTRLQFHLITGLHLVH